MSCDQDKLDELSNLAKEKLGTSVEGDDQVYGDREFYVRDFLEAFLYCNEDLIELANNDPSSNSANAIQERLEEELGFGINEIGPDLVDGVLLQIQNANGRNAAQLAEKKKVIGGKSTDHKAHQGADPVMLFKGQFVHETDDIRISGAGIDFLFKRSYKNQIIFNGPLGYNWTHNFHISLREGEKVIFRTTGDLREEGYIRHPLFDETATGGNFNYWMPQDGTHGIILSLNDSYILRQPNGTRQIFEVDPSHSFLHRLSKIEDRFGNYLELVYDGQTNQLIQIEINHPKRLVQFHYDPEGRICSIKDYSGRQWAYAYDSHGDLTAVTSPMTNRYDCGLTVHYDYSTAFHSGNLKHNLTRIIDASGQIYLETEYGTSRGLFNFNRVVRQRQGGGEYQFQYENIDQEFAIDYPDELRPTQQTILVERNGQSICHIYNKFGNLLRRDQCIIENGLPRLLVEHYRYNRDSSLIASLSPEGVLTQHLYGREFFVFKHGLTANKELHLNLLTQQERQAFGRVLTTVKRHGYATFYSFNQSEDEWGNFPDIIDGQFPISLPNRDKDIIIKMTYEEEFGQLETISDPRYTNSTIPDANIEHPRNEDTLTKYSYSGITKLLSKIEYPQATLPNGLPGPSVEEFFTDYDSRGRLLRSVNPVGVVTELSYFDDSNEVSSGHLEKVIIDDGGLNNTTRNEVDELGRVTAVHSPKSISAADGRFVTRSVYNELDQLIEATSTAPFNFKTQNFYDRNGKLERKESDLRNEDGQPELGGLAVATFCYDQEFNLIESSIGGTDLTAHLVTKYLYDRAGKKILSILPNGNQLRIRYDERQLPVNQIAGAGSEDAATVRTDYNGDGRVRRTFDARGNSSKFEFDSFGRVIATENALGHITRTNYDKASNITCVRVFEKQDIGYVMLTRSETQYDELNRAIRSGVSRFENPLGPYNLSQLAEMHLSSPGPWNLLETLTFYDAKGRIDHTVNSHPLRRETHFKYDTLDRIKTITDPLGNETHNEYDEHNNLIRIDQLDRVLDDFGIEIGQRHFANSSEFDELDRMINKTDSLGNVSRNFYDSRNNVVRQIDPLGNEQRRSFDIFNRLTTSINFLTATGLGPVIPNDQAVSVFQEYDKNSNLIAVVDALGRRTRYQYDELDRRRAIIYPDDTQMRTDYDVDSNIVRTQDNNGLQRFYTVDALSRTTKVEVDVPIGLEIGGATFERYTFDGLNRLTQTENDFAVCRYRYNSLSWQLAEKIEFIINDAPLQIPFSIVRDFDDVGTLVGLTYPNGRQLQFERDELNRLTRIQNRSYGNGYRGHLNLPPLRSIAQMNYVGQQKGQCIFGNNASINYRYDGAGRLIEIAHANGNTALIAIQYLYDAANNVRVRNNVLPAGSRTERFAYDALYRLVLEFQPTTNETFDLTNFGPSNVILSDPIPNGQSDIDLLIGSMALPQILPTYDYDLVGNRQIEIPSGGDDIDYSNNNLDQYESRDGTNFIHDTNGNLKNDEQRKYIFDALNRLVKVETVNGQPIMEFWHDASGRRILERNALTGIITQLIHDGDDIISEYQNGNLFAQYVFDDGIDRPLQVAAEGKEHWYHADLVGSVRVLTDITGTDLVKYRYLPFGAFDIIEPDDGNIFNPWRYTGRRFDVDLETYDYRARQYDPKVGRFVQRDPGGMADSTNLFTYTINNPLSATDPSGYSRKEMNHPEHPPAMDFSTVDSSIVVDPALRIASTVDTGLDVLDAVDSRAELKIGASLFSDYSWGNVNNYAKFQSINPPVNPSSSLGAFLQHPFVKGLGTALSFLGVALDSYKFYKEPTVESGVDLTASSAGLYGALASGPTALAGTAFAAGYGLGKIGTWTSKKLGYDTSEKFSDALTSVTPNFWVNSLPEKTIRLRPLEEGFLSRQLVCYGPGQECRYDLYERDPKTRQIQEAGFEYGGFITDKNVYISPVRSVKD